MTCPQSKMTTSALCGHGIEQSGQVTNSCPDIDLLNMFSCFSKMELMSESVPHSGLCNLSFVAMWSCCEFQRSCLQASEARGSRGLLFFFPFWARLFDPQDAHKTIQKTFPLLPMCIPWQPQTLCPELFLVREEVQAEGTLSQPCLFS